MSFLRSIENNPRTGTVGTISAFLVGMLPQVDPQIQTTIIFYFQVMAFLVSILVGVLTIASYIRRFRRENRENAKP
jgi:hypothetical protein